MGVGRSSPTLEPWLPVLQKGAAALLEVLTIEVGEGEMLFVGREPVQPGVSQHGLADLLVAAV